MAHTPLLHRKIPEGRGPWSAYPVSPGIQILFLILAEKCYDLLTCLFMKLDPEFALSIDFTPYSKYLNSKVAYVS